MKWLERRSKAPDAIWSQFAKATNNEACTHQESLDRTTGGHMESGAVVGGLSSLACIGAAGWAIERHFSCSRSLARALVDGALLVAVMGGICGGNYLLASGLNATDSSLGVLSLGMPMFVGTIATTVAVSAFALGVFRKENARASGLGSTGHGARHR